MPQTLASSSEPQGEGQGPQLQRGDEATGGRAWLMSGKCRSPDLFVSFGFEVGGASGARVSFGFDARRGRGRRTGDIHGLAAASRSGDRARSS
eukprot:COSAG02_NODE_4583_length_5190_cov_4.804753_1_plen_93_part_00